MTQYPYVPDNDELYSQLSSLLYLLGIDSAKSLIQNIFLFDPSSYTSTRRVSYLYAQRFK